MIRHIVLIKWRDDLSADEMAEVRTRLDNLANVSAVEVVAHGPSLGLGGVGVDYALTVDLEDATAFGAYLADPIHDLAREILPTAAAEVRAVQFKLPS